MAAAMGRKRKTDRDLPKYWKRSHGAIYLIVPRRLATIGKPGAWIRLGETEEEAHRTYADLLAGERAGTMQQIFDRYEKDEVPKKAPKTQKEYRLQLVRLSDWCGQTPIGSLTRAMVQQYVDRRPPVAGNRELSLLSHVCKKAIRWGLLNTNPCDDVERNQERPAREGADHLSMMLAWRAAKPWMRALMALAYVIGQRRGDVRLIKESDFGPRGLRLVQGKTKTELLLLHTRGLRLAKEYALSVRPVTPMNRWLVCNEFGRPISEAVFKREWARVRGEVKTAGGEPFKFKSLRAQSATDHPTGEHLGHVDARVLQKHYRLGPKSVRPL